MLIKVEVKPALTKEQQAAKKAQEFGGYRGAGKDPQIIYSLAVFTLKNYVAFFFVNVFAFIQVEDKFVTSLCFTDYWKLPVQ